MPLLIADFYPAVRSPLGQRAQSLRPCAFINLTVFYGLLFGRVSFPIQQTRDVNNQVPIYVKRLSATSQCNLMINGGYD